MNPIVVPMRLRPSCARCGREVVEGHRRPYNETFWDWLSETAEIGLGSACGWVTWRFMVNVESAEEYGRNHGQDATDGDNKMVFFNPSPALMLVSCLVFGCCVSSFVHRRQDKDPFQFLVYIVLLASVVIIGREIEASANMILLGYLPWTMCLAMAISISGHSLCRQGNYALNTTRAGDSEKGEFLF